MFETEAIRVILVVGSLCTAVFMLQRIRAAKVQIRDSIFWLVFSALLLVLSIFPGIASWASRQLGFMAPINFVYLFIIFLLVIKLFSTTVRISQMDARLQQLTQRLALAEKEREDTAAPENAPQDEQPSPHQP